MRQILSFSMKLFCILVVMGATAWAATAIYYSNLPGGFLRLGLAAGFAAATFLAFLLLPNRKRTLGGFLLIFAAVVVWWLGIPASNIRDWQKEVARPAWADIRGDLITIHNIRNFLYRTETDFDANYYDKTFDLKRLNSVDLIAVYWMGEAVAHIMLSFGFAGEDFVTFSIETRKEVGEDYSTIKGFFKQYELLYIVGDERDLIRVRTDFRTPQEDVYLFQVRMSPENIRRFFMEYIHQINSMKAAPEWYNTLTTNCTTNVLGHIRAFGGKVKYDWKVLLSGYAPQYAYELGALDTGLPFPELKRRGYINPKAHALGDDPAFSRKIREGITQ